MGRIIEQHFTLLGKLSKCNYCLWSLTKLSKKSLDKELQYKHLLFNHQSVLQSSQNSSSQNDADDDDDEIDEDENENDEDEDEDDEDQGEDVNDDDEESQS